MASLRAALLAVLGPCLACTMANPEFAEKQGLGGDGSTEDTGLAETSEAETDTHSMETSSAETDSDTETGTETETDTDPETDTGPECEAPEELCGRDCVDVAVDELHCGECGEACPGDEECLNFGCYPAGGRLVFLTSDAIPGNELGPLEAAHETCNSLADEAGFPGSYKAWLGVGPNNPASSFIEGGPYYLVDGTIIAETTQDLFSGELLHPIDLTEHGDLPSLPDFPYNCESADTFAWSAITPSGQTGSSNCGGWTTYADNLFGDVGTPESAGETWTYLGSCAFNCALPLPFYCFQQ